MEEIILESNTLQAMIIVYLNKRAQGFRKCSEIKIKNKQVFENGEVKALYTIEMCRETNI